MVKQVQILHQRRYFLFEVILSSVCLFLMTTEAVGVSYPFQWAFRRDVSVGVRLDLSTPTGMSCIGTYGENCKSDLSKYRVLLVAFLLVWQEN